jgi:ferredoxin
MASKIHDSIEGLKSPRLLRPMFDIVDHLFKLTWLPGMQRHPWMRPEKTDMRWLPINQDIEMPDNTPMPLAVLDRLIDEASHRVLFNYCGCRLAYDCQDYPVEIGCLLMGDSAIETTSSNAREVTPEEAKEAARKAVDAGLVPIVGKARIDNALFAIKDRGHLLTVCFCCECCCITRFVRHIPQERMEPLFPRLEGISIEVTDDCKGCGTCAKHCYIQAITIEDKHAVISEYCRACGRCATVCPRDAINIKLEDEDFLDKTIDRIRSYVKYD